MDVFELRDSLIGNYEDYVRGFINIRDESVRDKVDAELEKGILWPNPLIQLNPSFEPGESIDQLVQAGVIHQECQKIFVKGKSPDNPIGHGVLNLHKHQSEAIHTARNGQDYVLTTGTGSGKSLSYIIPIVDFVLQNGSGKGIKAIIVYPMNALANSQEGELEKFLNYGYPDQKGPVSFARYTGQESDERRKGIIARPPDILLTNYVMLELLLTRPEEKPLIQAGQDLRFLVLDELHTYRGRQGADVAMLVRRTRNAFNATNLQCVGTSATLAGSGTYEEQRNEVAGVASLIFGTPVQSSNVIMETLQRATSEIDFELYNNKKKLKKRIQNVSIKPGIDYQTFIEDPLSSWIESAFGVTRDEESGRLIRSKPISITGEQGASLRLSKLIDCPESRCADIIKEQLLGSYRCERNPKTGFPIFAFRLHQFISRGDTVYASMERENERYLTLQGQKFVPGSNRSKILLPLVFCRECGQDYYCVRKDKDDNSGTVSFIPRELNDRADEEHSEAGFLFYSSDDPWPDDVGEIINRLPDDWLEEHKGYLRIKKSRQKNLPRSITVSPAGFHGQSGLKMHYFQAPFRFCLRCGVAYNFRQRSDFAMLSSLGTEGRSTATTILSLASVLYLRGSDIEKQAQKLLSFTDNRQDAALQAGHFNDFIEIGLLRSALYKAANKTEIAGITHEDLVHKVFDELRLPLELYSVDPDVRFSALEETKRALKSVIGYRLYRDLKRGWRITAPNLEQSGLLEIKYISMDEVCQADDVWQQVKDNGELKNCHAALAGASEQTRKKISKTLLDLMRRELAVKVDYLEPDTQDKIKQLSSQRLLPPWAIDENEKMETSSILFPRPQRPKDYGGHVFLSPRGGFGQYLRRNTTFPEYDGTLSLSDLEEIVKQLLECLRIAGLVEIVEEPINDDDVPGYQLPASAILWAAGDGTTAFHDPIRVPRASDDGQRTNPFFVEFYKNIAEKGLGLEAREHTAQVQYEARIDRENRFREANLPILYCSPTMELGVDIADLNAVNMRNVPPTPANYAQRSGRAGRSGQPALVFTYCTTYSPHDQYFFKRPNLMVAGAVTPPRLELANEDLVRSHIQAIWLSETNLKLGTSLKDVLDLDGEEPTLELLDSVKDAINSNLAKQNSKSQADKVLNSIKYLLTESPWYSEGWLQEVLNQIGLKFERACDRWRGLYRAAARQRNYQHKIANDHSRTSEERQRARRLRSEAESQLELLTEGQRVIESDFYSYRYFASEGFLPGYNFPRLPLSAFIPGRRSKRGRDEFLSRPRFLAISEYGPRAIVYHEGSRYRINKVILPVSESIESDELPTASVKKCENCGYLHPIFEGDGPDLCERCGIVLNLPMRQLFRLQNVATKRAEKINSDEEERVRLGYEIKTGVRFAERQGGFSYKTATVRYSGEDIATLTYGSTATLWRINLGWTRRANKDQYGFLLDTEKGFWASNQQDPEDDEQDPKAQLQKRVIPFVEDRKNCMIIEPIEGMEIEMMASLQSALKNAIQIEYQLEEFELAAEPLPSGDNRRLLLFYEAAEGGAGVLRRLLEEGQISRVARQALDLCHFDPETGEDRHRAPGASEDCVAACYDCLMSYSNQPDHIRLDRQIIKDFLIQLRDAHVDSSPTSIPRATHLNQLMNLCQSGLEKKWLQLLEENELMLPSKAQALIESCGTRPDFIYEENQTVIYVDGPPHEYPERQARDQDQADCLEDLGYTVLRFNHQDDWLPIIERHPNIFGKVS